MTIEEAKNILINRGFVEINGYQIYDGDKWRNAIALISKWLEQQPCENTINQKIDEFELNGKTAEIWIIKGKLQIRYLGIIHNIPLSSVVPQYCEDAVSRQSALNVVHRYFEHYLQLNDDICLDGLRSLPSVEPKEKTGWIPISERLPEFNQDVLLSLRSLDVVTGFRAETEPYFYCRGLPGCYIKPKDVLAWMPLPEPYKESEKI